MKRRLTAKRSYQLALVCPQHAAYNRKARKGARKLAKNFFASLAIIFAIFAG
jgi:hypothetical protein